MGLSSALTDAAASLVADASTIINLVATGNAAAILRAIPQRVLVVDIVQTELEAAGARGRASLEGFRELVATGLIDVAPLPEAADPVFESLVVGAAAETLDDGEAATIACALARRAAALVDERKATRLCGARFPHLVLASTVDLLCHAEVQRQFGRGLLEAAVYNALREGRMSVLPHQVDWVVDMIGSERAAACESLPRRVRVAGIEPGRGQPSTTREQH
jgi:predicted nucleic acid-binding protein